MKILAPSLFLAGILAQDNEANNGTFPEEITQGDKMSVVHNLELFLESPMGKSILGPQKFGHRPKIMEKINQALDAFKLYGCWCNYENYKAGRGQTLDQFDGYCKKLHDNLLCIEEQHSCNAMTTEYVIGGLARNLWEVYDAYIQNDGEQVDRRTKHLIHACTLKNKGDTCAQEICMADMQFLVDMHLFAQYYDQPIWEHLDTNFRWNHTDVSENKIERKCRPIVTHVEKSNIGCCGSTPFRFRYDLNKGKSCCHDANKLFDRKNKCCQEAGLINIGGKKKSQQQWITVSGEVLDKEQCRNVGEE